MVCDPYWTSTVLALHMNGTNGSTTFTDAAGKTVTANGNAQVSTEQSKFGGASAYFDGAGDYLSVPSSTDFQFGSGNFTIEFWFYPLTLTGGSSGVATLVSVWGISTNFSFVVYRVNSGFQFSISTNGTTQINAVSVASGVFSLSTWHHVEVVRNGSDIKAFVNGAQVGSTYNISSSSLYASTNALNIGYNSVAAYGPEYGYIDELRITKGISRHIKGGFDVPSSEFPTTQCAISGVAKDASGSLAKKLIRLYRRDTGALVGSMLSNATTGAYSINTSYSGQHFVIEHDASSDPPSGGSENADILDMVDPA